MGFKSFPATLKLCLIVFVLLGLLSVIPAFKLFDFQVKRIDLLSSVRPDVKDEEPLIAMSEPEKVAIKLDSAAKENQSACKAGVTCFEDFTPDKKGLKPIVDALSKLKSEKRTVRIAFYGDSFIEGDVFCGSFRDTLQTVFGGRGVGFVPITSDITGFRNTIRHSFDYWRTYSIISKKDSSVRPMDMGPAGYCFRPLEENWVEYKASKQRYLREFSVMKLFYKNPGSSTLYYTINDTISGASILKKGKGLKQWEFKTTGAKSVEYQFDEVDSLELYGASFEGNEGVYVDNFSMRGNSGIALYSIPDKMLKDFNQLRDYKLILLQYGLNVIRNDSSRYNWYAERMIVVIEKLKKAFPKASIVLVSVSDRSTNLGGKYGTENSIPALRNTQRYIAQKTGIAFWDLYQAMGGKNSMVKFVTSKPALAAKDYTHLTFKGGKKLGGELAKSLLYELERYEKLKQLNQ